MRKTRRHFTGDFKISIVRELESGKSVAQLSREHDIHPVVLNRWWREFTDDPKNAFSGPGTAFKSEARVAELERILGQLYAENEFLKKALKTLEEKLQEKKKMNKQR